ncbi:MAG: hypothetical protein H7Y88_00330 [Phycisphaerales bacterium]|nr:hypothetical protein [Phycisphaerales bacterium]
MIDQYSDVKLTEIARAELLDRPIPVAQPLPTNLTTSEVDALIRPYLGIGQWRPPNREPSALDGTPRESSSDLVKNLSLSLERDRHIAKLRAAGRLGRDDEATGLSLDELRKQAADLPDPPTDKP